MFGIRATTEQVASKAAALLITAKDTAAVIASRTFATNQASGDHIECSFTTKVCTVTTLKGGHTTIETERDNLVSFSAGADMNRLAQWLQRGDEIEYLGLQDREGVIHLEALKLLSATGKQRPTCVCGKRMKSMGKGQGVRCPKCKITQDQQWIFTDREPPSTGWTQPPFDCRRHLARQIV
jgi:tRNA(Ile2)-agmatinylcytidine synthase